MAAMGLGQALRTALDLLDAGRAAEAEELCRRIIDAAAGIFERFASTNPGLAVVPRPVFHRGAGGGLS
jgi:phage tail protein X